MANTVHDIVLKFFVERDLFSAERVPASSDAQLPKDENVMPIYASVNKQAKKKKDVSDGVNNGHLPVTNMDSGGGPPLSARSSMSGISLGGDDNTWSDNDSLFSSTNDAKPSLVKLKASAAQGKNTQG